MKVLRSELIRLFEALGWAAARKWGPGKMMGRLGSMVSMVQDGSVDSLEDEGLTELLQSLVEANGEVEIVSKESDLDEPPEVNGGFFSAIDEKVAKVQKESGEAEPDDPVIEEEFEVVELDEEVPLQKEEVIPLPILEPLKKEKPKKKNTPKEKGKHPKIMGKYSAGSFVRWLGIQGVDLEGAKSILEFEGIVHLKETSIKMELKERRGKHDPAKVLQEDQDNFKKKYSRFFGEGNV